MTQPLTLAAIRFTDDVPTMRRFLETLGLATTSTRGDGWAVLTGASGQVWLHDADSSDRENHCGVTQLTGNVENLDAYEAHVSAHGIACSVVDEAYARTLEISTPDGRILVVHEHDPEGYGYEQHDSTPDSRMTLSMCLFTDPQGEYGTFAEALGLRREGELNQWYVPFSAGTGILGLHHDDGSHTMPDSGTAPSVTLGLTTSTPLEEVQQRLRDGGYDAGTLVTEDFGSLLETIDPDGRPLQIHASAAAAE